MACTGMCCAAFPLSRGLDEITCDTEDGLDLLDMLIPLTRAQATDRLQAVGSPRATEDGRSYFTCRHFDLAERRCDNYRHRPAMCRNYPYGKPCEHGCDCTDARPLVWDGDYA